MSLYISSICRAGLEPVLGKKTSKGPIPVRSARFARELAAAIQRPDGVSADLSGGELMALGLIADAYGKLLDTYLDRVDGNLMPRLLSALKREVGAKAVEGLLQEFSAEFLHRTRTVSDTAISQPATGANRDSAGQAVLRELLIFWLLETNPGARPAVQYLHAAPLLRSSVYKELTRVAREVLDREPGPETEGSLYQKLVEPARRSPSSLTDQLRWIQSRWEPIGVGFVDEIAMALDVLAEEHRPIFPVGPGPVELPNYEDDEEDEGEASYSADRSWMGSLVLVAKHALVWLDQLSRQYERSISRLDQIPDEELGRLSSLGFNGVWLIGLWQRSPASQTIKRLCGNPEAVASAYSLTKYVVAEDLGGEESLEKLKARAAAYGIRLAADMVPNHTGLDSDVVLDRPDWFVGQDRSPYPAYEFDGPDLSPRPDVEIYLESHYFDRTDAAVVFKRVDRDRGRERYIYHGNDGTSMPWNDTAQLDYLNPEVRESVIQTILDVARKVPIIRFDAAMTLTRKHFQRLWFPVPGSGGAIPSRAEHAMTKAEFDRLMPTEFWREVVDRIAVEAPETLLLAEAFWLLEGYFVRSLGMHRVYNSAFMNMLRDGETAKYRKLLSDTLVFDPQILKRYVNFMNNPDERTAIDQFGREDRYFGVCALMATLPGLPMFGHGQVEGLSERYGMEYGRAYSDEQPDAELIRRHQKQIKPLLERRELFAGVEEFRLYDFQDSNDVVLEDVIAFSNSVDKEKVVVVFNNSPHTQRGRLQKSTPRRDPATGEKETSTIGDVLAQAEINRLLRYRDLATGSKLTIDTDRLREEGLEFDLAGYEYRVMTEFRGLSIEGLIKALGEVIEAMRSLTANERLMKIVDLSQVDESSKTTSE